MSLPNTLKAPAFLQKLQWTANPVKYFEGAAQQHPDIFTAEIVGFGETVVFVNHPQAIQEIFTNDASGTVQSVGRKKFAALGEKNRILQPLLGNHSLLMLSGERHKRRRQIAMPPFHGERMRAYGSLMCKLTENIYTHLPLNEPFSARFVMQEISLQIMLQAVFGLYEGERCQKLKYLLTSLMDNFISPVTSGFLLFSFLQKNLGSWSPWGRFLSQRQQIDELIYAEIAERREENNLERIDILSLLMSAKDEMGNSMTDEELRDELMTLILAGYETTATAMAWAMYWIHRQPEVYQKLLEEIDTLGDHPDSMEIFRLPYLSAVCNETLRIHPSVMVTMPRVVQEPVKLLGYALEPGTVLLTSVYLTHHRQDLYPQPQQFKPERFLERQFSPYEFIPFGGGSRSCIGQALGMFEMKLVLATLLSNYQLALAERKPEKLQRRGFTLAPANGVKMVIKGRRVRQRSQVPTATAPAH
ncbi:cytochrome P450 [Nostoc cycadae]|uniref:Cytochrome P450 n=1 Tax=Nostoc cycadae WK-1 TaxID=1861711 RepID=A0A2H6LIS3_9NOSO|nr:cytochrome P450 [Nostoc cycadae]GBE93122.1 cytochrome P450 [Nostoc cycadae WK-1]